VWLQQVRLVIDRCDSATTRETDDAWTEDRRPCEAVSDTPGDAEHVNVILPLQLGGRMRPEAEYPRHVIRDGFRGCVKNLVHNGQVRTELRTRHRRSVLSLISSVLCHPVPDVSSYSAFNASKHLYLSVSEVRQSCHSPVQSFSTEAFSSSKMHSWHVGLGFTPDTTGFRRGAIA